MKYITLLLLALVAIATAAEVKEAQKTSLKETKLSLKQKREYVENLRLFFQLTSSL
jgi:hypothetical protein